MCKSERPRIIECNIGPRDVSDHSAVHLKIHLDIKPRNVVWRLNTSLLNDQKCEEFIKKVNEFLEVNDNGEVSPSTLWDTAKAVLRGKLIMWSARKKREEERQQTINVK